VVVVASVGDANGMARAAAPLHRRAEKNEEGKGEVPE